jgi:hypothetical protein
MDRLCSAAEAVAQLVGAPHLTHAAAAQQLHHAVATERRPVSSVLPCHGQDVSDPSQPAQSIGNQIALVRV